MKGGTVQFFDATSYAATVALDDGGPDIFVPDEVLRPMRLAVGQRVAVEVKRASRVATSITLPESRASAKSVAALPYESSATGT